MICLTVPGSLLWLPLGLAVAVTVAAAVTAHGSGKSDPPWVRTQP